MERCAETLLALVKRVCSSDIPPPFSPVLENAYPPDTNRIREAFRDVVRYEGSRRLSNVTPLTSAILMNPTHVYMRRIHRETFSRPRVI